MSQERAQSGATLKAKMMAMAILGMARRTYQAAGIKESKEHRTTFGGGRSGGYVNPADFYGHGSRTFLKNKRRGL